MFEKKGERWGWGVGGGGHGMGNNIEGLLMTLSSRTNAAPMCDTKVEPRCVLFRVFLDGTGYRVRRLRESAVAAAPGRGSSQARKGSAG